MSYAFTFSGIIHGNVTEDEVSSFMYDIIEAVETHDTLDAEVTYDFTEEEDEDIDDEDDDE